MKTLCLSDNKIIRRYDSEIIIIEPWGENSLRVRATCEGKMPENDWALLPQKEKIKADITPSEEFYTIKNGKISAVITEKGEISFYNEKGKALLREFSSLEFLGVRKYGREFQPIPGGDYKLTVRFAPNDEEKLYGMGQYQQPYLNLKGCALELAHRNSQASIPFAVSSQGYGVLWNNPAIGRATFGTNVTEWEAFSTKVMDYWITAGDTPAQIVEQYASVTGTVPMMPDYAMGFWQCKLRYRTQEELLEVAREYKKRNLPIDVIVADFFHWPHQGDWRFDENYWPDPAAMVAELEEMGIKLMVSIWPTVDRESENYKEMFSKGMLVRTNRGVRTTMQFVNDTLFYDATNEQARKFVWKTAKKNYFDKDIKIFWLDEAEPEFHAYDYDNFRYSQGSALEIGNLYPMLYSKTFYDGQKEEGLDNVINLVRCAWAGSQRYGALVWSGDVASSFTSFRNQFAAGLNTAMAGIPWWTTDIGGFYGGDPTDEKFRELMCRWFQFGMVSPVFRLHGERVPTKEPTGTEGGGKFGSGADNEVWSYGEEAYEIFVKYMNLREKMKPYIKENMELAHIKGTPIMRPLFYDFPEDAKTWETEDELMFGPDVLAAPVLYERASERKVYLPKGTDWIEWETGKSFEGGQSVMCDAPISSMPIFVRKGSKVFDIIKK